MNMLSNHEHKIPLNNKNFFIIRKGPWSFTIDILMEDFFNFNIFNLFYIFKCYTYHDKIYLRNVYITISKNNDSSYTYKKIDVKVLRECNFNFFVRFIEDILSNEKEYVKDYRYIGFRLIFDKNSRIIQDNKIYPIYPWDDDIKANMLKNSIYGENYSSENKFFEHTIESIQNKHENEIKELKENYKNMENSLLKRIKELEKQLNKK